MTPESTPAPALSQAQVAERLRKLRAAAAILRGLPRETKDAALHAAAQLLKERAPEILRANALDLQALDVDAARASQAKGNGSELAVRGFASKATPAFRDRLLLNEQRLAAMGESLRRVAILEDPVGEEVDKRTLPNGLLVRRVRSPLGVILMIFESRPNVATEAFSLAFKSGNAIILRGGKESMRSTEALYAVLREALAEAGAPEDALWGVTDPDRALVLDLLQRNRSIDLVVPRGGASLISFVEENSQIPIIKNDRGLCHVYVHEDASLEMAEKIVVNAKTQRPGVCNAMETVLVHRSVAARLLPALYEKMRPLGVRWNGCGATLKILFGKQDVRAASADSWDTEWLDMIMNCRVVDSLDEALAHIDAHGSRHSEAIVTSSEQAARRFQSEVDAAATYWNASTRFTDGFEFGLGGELGISTQKLHVRGPVGLRELTSPRWIVDGNGQTRA